MDFFNNDNYDCKIFKDDDFIMSDEDDFVSDNLEYIIERYNNVELALRLYRMKKIIHKINEKMEN